MFATRYAIDAAIRRHYLRHMPPYADILLRYDIFADAMPPAYRHYADTPYFR